MCCSPTSGRANRIWAWNNNMFTMLLSLEICFIEYHCKRNTVNYETYLRRHQHCKNHVVLSRNTNNPPWRWYITRRNMDEGCGKYFVTLTYMCIWGTAVAQWLGCCATNRKVAGSIPAGVSGFFIEIKSFRSHYGPGVDSASNINEYQEYFLG